MTVQIIAEHPDGWCMTATDDEPDEVKNIAEVLTRQVRAGLRGTPSSTVVRTAVEQARNRAMRQANEQTPGQRKLAHSLARELLLDREDRLALAEVLCERDVGSWNELSWEELSRVIDAMNGYVLVRHARLEKSRAPEGARGQG